MSDVVLRRQEGETAWLTMNRPDALNALSFDLTAAMIGQLREIAHDDSTRVVVITGTGRAFCAGADLKGLVEPRDPGEPDILDAAVDLFTEVRNFPKPVIMALNGLALAGGMELMMCGDLIYAGESAKIGDAHANYGLVPGGGGAAIAPRFLPMPIVKYMMFTGEFIPATELLQYGLLNDVVADDQLEKTVQQVADKISEKSPLGISRMKRVANEALDKTAADAIRDERLAARDQFRSADFAEGMKAFMEKRKPVFKGK